LCRKKERVRREYRPCEGGEVLAPKIPEHRTTLAVNSHQAAWAGISVDLPIIRTNKGKRSATLASKITHVYAGGNNHKRGNTAQYGPVQP
jgi:hypothetical protein